MKIHIGNYSFDNLDEYKVHLEKLWGIDCIDDNLDEMIGDLMKYQNLVDMEDEE